MMRLCLFFLLSFPLIGLAQQSTENKRCVDLSGRYAFEGQSETFEADGADATAIREEALKTPPQIDERALSIFARSIIRPSAMIVKHDMLSAVVTIDIVGSGISEQWKQYGPFLPMKISLACRGRRWLRESVAHGKGGFASTESRNEIFLTLDVNQDLYTDGTKSITSGLLFKDKLKMRWIAKFRRIGQD